MFALSCRRGFRVPFKHCNIFHPQNAAMAKSCSSSVCENASEKSFTVSYLINTCGLSSKDAISLSKKLHFKSPNKPDAVLALFRSFGFTSTDISSLVARCPYILSTTCPNETLLPKLDFFRSIGIPLPVLAQKLSRHPSVLSRSLEHSIIPWYNCLRSLLQSDKRVAIVFSSAPMVFERCSVEREFFSMLRERGVPESSILSLVMRKPTLLITGKDKLASYVDRAVEMGFDVSKSEFLTAIRVFLNMGESALKRKMEVYRRCGLSESEVKAAFLRYPSCMVLGEKKIMANMDFLVNELGFRAAAVAECPELLTYSLEERLKPRCLVAAILNEKGLLKRTSMGMIALLESSEERFLKRYIVKYEKDVPELLGIYQESRVSFHKQRVDET